MSVHNDGWQKQTSIANNIRDRGNQDRKATVNAEKTQASKAMQALHSGKSASEAGKTAATEQVRQPQPAQAAKEAPSKARVETQAEAARQTPDAGKQFIENRDAAKQLNQLSSSKAPVTNSGDRAATATAVTQKGKTVESNLMQQPTPQTTANARKTAENAERRAAADNVSKFIAQAHKGKDEAEGKKAADGLPQADPKQLPGKEGATAAQVAAGTGIQQNVFEKPASRERGEGADGEKKSAKKAEGGKNAKGGVYAREGNAGGQLNALLSGGTGGGSSESDAQDLVPTNAVVAEGSVGNADAPEAMPETDPHFHVYSEFDEANPGVEAVKSKAQLFGRLVEKRLVEIAKINDEVAQGIVALSQRIEGDAETAKALAKAIGRRDSVYGMMKG